MDVKKTNRKPLPPGPGRPKGCKNKITLALKEAILLAAEGAHKGGTVGYLQAQANENPTAFLSLLGKVLPSTIQQTLNGEVTLLVATGVPRADRG
jgi:hypothetical protein